MPYAAAITGGIKMLGSIHGANKSASSARKANKLAYQMFREEMDWEREKANNAYQWTVADMEKAGINPILGATNNGATSVGSPSIPSTHQSQEGQILAQGMQAAVNTAQKQLEINNQTQIANTQSAKNIADATKTMEEAGILNSTGKKKALAEIENLTGTAKKNRVIGNASEKGAEILNQATSSAKTFAEKVGEKIADNIYGGDLSKMSFEKRMERAKNRQKWQRLGIK